jgi:alpha-tubulin suppressor-like RCC1 family protein
MHRPTALGLLVLALAAAASGAEVVSIWGGARGTVVLKSDGTVWTWGANFGGKLGVGSMTLTRTNVPTEVHGPGDVGLLNSIVAIMGGEAHNIAIRSDGTVWGWGQNSLGQLGNGTTNDSATPVQVGLGCNPPLTSVTKLGGRTYWNLAVKSDGTVWAWGMDSFGQVGNGTVTPLSTTQITVPVQVSNSQPGGAIHSPVQVSCGYTYGVALLTNGTVWTWGTGPNGELGNGTSGTLATNYTPGQVIGLSNITAISSGWKHILALKSDGTVWAWGKNLSGELGDGTTQNRSLPVQVLNLSNVVSISGGDYNSAALKSDGTVWKWGLDDVGELGNGTADGNPHAFASQVSSDEFGAGFNKVVKVAARDYHNIAVKADGSVWMWGANDQGQCGDGTYTDAWKPVPVVGLGARVAKPLNLKSSAQPGCVDLSWNSGAGEYYTVQYTTNLAQGFPGVFQSNILSTPPVNTLTVPATNAWGHFRLAF